MKKISLQWKLTLLTTVLITILCGCLTFFLYKNGVYYFDTLQESITDQGTEPESVYIDIPDNEWDDFVSQFSMKVYNSKSDYRKIIRSKRIRLQSWTDFAYLTIRCLYGFRNHSRRSAGLREMQHMSYVLHWL